MYMSKLIGKTLKKYDNEFNIPSQELLFRTGMFRELENGVYSALPLGVESVDKILRLILKRLHNHGFQRTYLPKNDFINNITLAVRNDIKSYKELPAFLYDVQMVDRENYKGKDGLIGSKETLKLRGCSFHEDNETISISYDKIRELYLGIFKEMGIDAMPLKDYYSKGNLKIGHSFVVEAETGDRVLYKCNECGQSQLKEKANFYVEDKKEITEEQTKEIYTPGVKSIKDLTEFLDIKEKDIAKTLLIKAEDEVVAVVVRGDRELNKYKLSRVLGVSVEKIKMAEEKDIENINTVTGFVGPVGLQNIKIIVDQEIDNGGPLFVGANKKDYHIKNVSVSRDIPFCTIANVSFIKEADKCPNCGGELQKSSGVDIGGIFNFGNSTNIKSFDYKDNNGITYSILGMYHYVDIYKLLSVIIEKHHDEHGIVWPLNISPYKVLVSILSTKNEDKVILGKKIYDELKSVNIDTLLDDRNEGVGAKFKDADLLGIPIRVTLGKRADEGIVEFKFRDRQDKEELKIHEALGKIMKTLKKEGILDR